MQMMYSPIVNGEPGTRLSMYGGQEMGDDPRLARMESDVPRAIRKREIKKTVYLRSNSFLFLFCFIV